ncbi:unnamed protein product [Mytilus coruscus]|uniref:nicotinamidase n=1 Tax=Mytilus coruscus TaxID=42192 RepID=A0A6J8C1E9_MYTCO|nr:unnamed protein product [Mytilus coruscus]
MDLVKTQNDFINSFKAKQKVFDPQQCAWCFHLFDENRDGYLDGKELDNLLSAVFSDGTESYTVSSDYKAELLKLLDQDQDDRLSKKDFLETCFYWLKQILQPVSALIVVDVQNDFLDGSLALRNCPAGQDGLGVIPAINSVLDTVNFDLVVYTRDWHPSNHISFIDNIDKRKLHSTNKILCSEAKAMDTVIFEGPPPTVQKLWPSHCIQGSWGSELHTELKNTDGGIIVNKGTHPNVDSYSAFWDNNRQSQTDLVKILSKHKVTDVYVCGVAYDVCVGFTCLDAVEHGFRTVLIEDACRGVDLTDIDEMRKNLKTNGAVISHSCKIKDLVEAHDRPPQLGLQTAKNVALARTLVAEGKVT